MWGCSRLVGESGRCVCWIARLEGGAGAEVESVDGYVVVMGDWFVPS